MTKDEAWWDQYELDKQHGFKSSHNQSSRSKGIVFGGAHVPSCFESHPPLKLGDTGLVIYGGSCSRPVVNDADVYIGFDGGMRFTKRHFPWNAGEEILYKIVDFEAPAEITEFRKLVEWTHDQLRAGRKVHCGCIGGHGRTGTFLAAIVKQATGIEDAITYVRANYCKKAVESQVQVQYLAKHFGILPAGGAKEFIKPAAHYGGPVSISSQGSKGSSKGKSEAVKHVQDGLSIWGTRCR
jgi:hypothetical protein